MSRTGSGQPLARGTATPGPMARIEARIGTRMGVLGLAVLMMAGCEDGAGLPFLQRGASDEAAAPAEASTRTRLVERDIEAPEVFQVSEPGLWDGRPSLGGVWVAHPDVKDPERVLIRNTSNGKFVIGALFRRERELPGPRLQISSDAAAALGMLAGAPMQVQVTALRREEVPEVAAEAVAPEVPNAPGAAGATEDATSLAAAPGVTATPLDPVAGIATGAIAAAEAAAPRTDAAKPDAAGTAAQATPPAPQAATAKPAQKPAQKPVSGLERPWLQIGIFSVEANAKGAAASLKSAGMLPVVRQQESKGKPFWRVLVGPATTATERDTLLKQIKAAGFTDAYAVTN